MVIQGRSPRSRYTVVKHHSGQTPGQSRPQHVVAMSLWMLSNQRRIYFTRVPYLLVLLWVVAVGDLIGKMRMGSFSLRVVAILFAGLAISAYDPKLALPQLVYTFGLVLFVYTVGISSGLPPLDLGVIQARNEGGRNVRFKGGGRVRDLPCGLAGPVMLFRTTPGPPSAGGQLR